MHYRMLVTLTPEPGETSLQARRRVFNRLMEDPSFCGEGGRFGCPVADWFVIGGRWSGWLADAAIGDAYRDRVKAAFPALGDKWYRDADAKAYAPAIDALWRECGGSGPSPLNRSGYEQYGFEDDAMLLTKDFYGSLLAGYAGVTSYRAGGQAQFIDLDDEELDESFVGRKWLVVVDYHS